MSGLLTRVLAHSWCSVNAHGMNKFPTMILKENLPGFTSGHPSPKDPGKETVGISLFLTGKQAQRDRERERALSRLHNRMLCPEPESEQWPSPCSVKKIKALSGEGTRPESHPLDSSLRGEDTEAQKGQGPQ